MSLTNRMRYLMILLGMISGVVLSQLIGPHNAVHFCFLGVAGYIIFGRGDNR